MRYICLALLALSIASAPGAELKPYTGAGCAAVDEYFANEVWAKVAAESCLKCHKAGGDAEDSKLILRDLSRVTGAARTEAMRANRDAFIRMAQVKEGNSTRLLLKATGKVKHGGKEAVKLDSTGQRILAEFVRLVNAPSAAAIAQAAANAEKNAPPFFAGVTMLDDRKLLDGLTTLSPEAARELAKYDGWLSLNGLKEISDEAAVALGQHKGVLHLNGLTKVSDGAANALAGHRGAAGVYLCGDHLWSASIEGAIISGLRAADAILKLS